MQVGDLSSPVAQFLQALKNEDQAAANEMKADMSGQNEINSLEKKAPSIDNVDQFLSDYGVRHAVLDTYGMKSMANATYLIKKLLTQDPDSSTSLAKTSNNAAWQSFADAFKAWGQGGGSVQTTPFTKSLVESVNSAYQDQANSVIHHDLSNFSTQSMMIHSADQLLDPKNASTLRIVLGAYDVSDLAEGANNADGTVNKNSALYRLLSQPMSDPNSLALQSQNPKWQAFAAAFDVWGRNGGHDPQMMTGSAVTSMITQYLQNKDSSGIGKFDSDISAGGAQGGTSQYAHFYNALTQGGVHDPDNMAGFIGNLYGMDASDVHAFLPKTSTLGSLPSNFFTNNYSQIHQLLSQFGSHDHVAHDAALPFSDLGDAHSLQTATKFLNGLLTGSAADGSTKDTINKLYQQSKMVDALSDAASFRSHIGNIKNISDLFKDTKTLGNVLSAYGINGTDATNLTSHLFNESGHVDHTSQLFKLLTGSGTAVGTAQQNLKSAFSGVFHVDGTPRNASNVSIFVGSDQNNNGLEQHIESKIIQNAASGSDPVAVGNALDRVHHISDLFGSEGQQAFSIISKAFGFSHLNQTSLTNLANNLHGMSTQIAHLSPHANWQNFVQDFGRWASSQQHPNTSGGTLPDGVKNAVIGRYIQSKNSSDSYAQNANDFLKAFSGASLDSVSDLLGSSHAKSILHVMLGASGFTDGQATNLINGMLLGGSTVNKNADLYKMLTVPKTSTDYPTVPSEQSAQYTKFAQLTSAWNLNNGRSISLFTTPGFTDSLSTDYQFRMNLHVSQTESDFSNSSGSLKTASDLLNNSSDLSLVQDKYGLSPLQDTRALFQILLTNDPDSTQSIAHLSNNKKWQALAHDFSIWGKSNGGSGGSSPFLTDTVNKMLQEVKSSNASDVRAAADHFSSNISHINDFNHLAGTHGGIEGDAISLRVLLQTYGLEKTDIYKDAFTSDGNSFKSGWTTSQGYRDLKNLFTYRGNDSRSVAPTLVPAGKSAASFATDMHNLMTQQTPGQPLINSAEAGKILADYRKQANNQIDLQAANVQSGFATLTNSNLIANDVSDSTSLAGHPAVLKVLLKHFGLDNSDFGLNISPPDASKALVDSSNVVRTGSQAWRNIQNLIKYDPSDSRSIIQTGGGSADEIQNEKDFSQFFKDYRLAGQPTFNPQAQQTLKDISGVKMASLSELLSTSGQSLPSASGGANIFVSADQNQENLVKLLHHFNINDLPTKQDDHGHAVLTDHSRKLISTLLTQDPNSSDSLVNQINKPKWKAFAQAFQLGGHHRSNIPTFMSGLGGSIVSRYSSKLGGQISNAINGFTDAMSSVSSVNDFIQNPHLSSALYLYSVARGAPDVATLADGALNTDGTVNTSSDLYKLLTQDPTRANSDAAMSKNSQWQDFAEFYKAITQDPNDAGSFVHNNPSSYWAQEMNNYRQQPPHADRLDGYAFKNAMINHLTVDFASQSYSNLDNAMGNFEQKIGSVTNAADLVSRPQLVSIIGEAYGMTEQENEHDVLKLLLTQDPNSGSSVAHLSGIATWQNFAKDMRAWGVAGGSVNPSPFTPKRLHSIVSEYEKNKYEGDKENTKDGVGNALYFNRKMGNVHNLYQLMSDPKLMTVVEQVNGLDPDEFGALDFDQQYRVLSNKVKFSDFSTPDKIRHYAERYLVMNQIHPQQQYEPETLMSLYGGNSDDDSILSLFGNGQKNNNSTLALFGIATPGPKKKTI